MQRLKAPTGEQASMLCDRSLDHSGWTPATLQLLCDLAARLPFEEAALVANRFGLAISKSELERLLSPVAQSCRALVYDTLAQAAEQVDAPAADPAQQARATSHPSRTLVLQVDGVRVLEKACEGGCGGIEVKTVVLYPQAAPSERLVLADIRSPEALDGAIQGLLQRAGVTPADQLIGLGDGAAWVEQCLDRFCDLRITDVYHAASYLELVMLALGWSETRRSATRRRFCRGDIDVGAWLEAHLPDPSVWLAWDDEALTALRYLETRQAHMRYPAFLAKGYPIGSGMIEGLNKSIVASRMKRSGMQWSRAGAARMAAWRALVTSKRPLVDFDTIRHRAFPPPRAPMLQVAGG